MPFWIEERAELELSGLHVLEGHPFNSDSFFVAEKQIAGISHFPQHHSPRPLLEIVSQIARFDLIKIADKGAEVHGGNIDDWKLVKNSPRRLVVSGCLTSTALTMSSQEI